MIFFGQFVWASRTAVESTVMLVKKPTGKKGPSPLPDGKFKAPTRN